MMLSGVSGFCKQTRTFKIKRRARTRPRIDNSLSSQAVPQKCMNITVENIQVVAGA